MTTPTTYIDRRTTDLPAGLLALLGLGLGALAVAFLATHPDPAGLWGVELLVTVAVSGAIAYAGYRLAGRGYDAEDLWAILGWSVVGIVGAVLLAAGIYAHQAVTRVGIAEPAFLFEFLALIGAAVGLGFGVTCRSSARERVDDVFDGEAPVDADAALPLLSRLSGDPETLRRRWAIVEAVATTTTREVPLPALAARLAGTEGFPDDRAAAEAVVDRQCSALAETGLVAIDDVRETVRYVGPRSLVDGA